MATFFERVGSAVSSIFSGSGNSPSEVTIQPGDTLSKIAAANNTTVDAIAKANNITDVDKIYAGNTLTIPGTTSSRSAPATSRDTGRDSNSSSVSRTANTSNTPAPAVDDSSTDNVTAGADRFTQILEAAGLEASSENIAAIASDPQKFMTERGLNLSSYLNDLQIDPEAAGTTLDPNNPSYELGGEFGYDATSIDASTVTDIPQAGDVSRVDTATSADKLDDPFYTAEAAKGEIRDENLANAEDYTIDMQGAATGVNKDGTRNLVGEALNNFASQSFSTIIDTSTVAGKLLANKMGEGNYLDSKATILGQMQILSGEFKDANGNPKIPVWAQAIARDLSRTIAFKGVTGTAATAAMTNAMMEATIGISEAEAKFFQTLTVENLDNRQEAIINKANVLSRFEVENLSARSAAAVQNARAFLEMDLQNLSNEQQAEILNKQARVDALFSDNAETNVNRRFNITNEIENRQFYDNLKTTVDMHNSTEINAMASRNADRKDAAAKWRAETELTRAKWESEMAYNIDVSNANWRRTIETENTRMKFEAASEDIRNSLGLATESMNRLWDRVDSEMDYIWKSVENDEDRDFQFMIEEMKAAAGAANAKSSSSGSILGAILGGIAKIASASVAVSDLRLKQDIRLYDTLPNGVNIYTWKWNEEGCRVGADKHPGFGVIAQEIMKTHPEAVITGEDGYLKVNYGKITQ